MGFLLLLIISSIILLWRSLPSDARVRVRAESETFERQQQYLRGGGINRFMDR